MIVTVAERKAREVERLRAAGSVAVAELRAYALDNGVRFAVFGSFARGELVPDSDFDVAVYGPLERQRMAREVAEALCERLGLRPDVLLASEVSDGLSVRIERDGLILP